MNSLVLGIEADANLSGFSRSATSIGTLILAPGDTGRIRSNFEGALVGKVGVAFDNAMLYVLGGVAAANFNARYNLPGTLGLTQSNSNLRFGWTAGAGVAYKISPNWSARLEYRYADLGRETHALGASGFSVRHNNTSHRVMLGLTYQFGGSAGPVVARY